MDHDNVSHDMSLVVDDPSALVAWVEDNLPQMVNGTVVAYQREDNRYDCRLTIVGTENATLLRIFCEGMKS